MSGFETTGAWLGVVSGERAERSVRLGIVQLGEGRAVALDRVRPGDTVVLYSPTETEGDAEPLRAVTALGSVVPGAAWCGRGVGFRPYRRAMTWSHDAGRVPIDDLRDRLELTASAGWRTRLRDGLLPLSASDALVIREAMTSSAA